MIKTPANRDFYDYWNDLRLNAAAGRPAPEQRLMDPALIGDALADVFIIDAPSDGLYEMRLAGTRLCGLWGRELRGVNALSLWRGRDEEGARMMLHCVIEDAAVAVVSHRMTTASGRVIEAEMVAMPLDRLVNGKRIRRVIGAFTPWETPFWLGSDPIIEQSIVSVRMVWPDETPRLDDQAYEIAAVDDGAPRHAGRAALRPSRARDGRVETEIAEGRLNGMPVLTRRAHLTLLAGGAD